VPDSVDEIPDGTPTLYKEGCTATTLRGHSIPSSVNWYIPLSLDTLATYSSYVFVDLISPHPLLMIAGPKAEALSFGRKSAL